MLLVFICHYSSSLPPPKLTVRKLYRQIVVDLYWAALYFSWLDFLEPINVTENNIIELFYLLEMSVTLKGAQLYRKTEVHFTSDILTYSKKKV